MADDALSPAQPRSSTGFKFPIADGKRCPAVNYQCLGHVREAQWPIGYGVGLRIKRSSVRILPWPLRWVIGQGSLLPLSQGEAFTLASISYLAILVKYILAKKKKSFGGVRTMYTQVHRFKHPPPKKKKDMPWNLLLTCKTLLELYLWEKTKGEKCQWLKVGLKRLSIFACRSTVNTNDQFIGLTIID